MSKKLKINILLFNKNLRVRDNEALKLAMQGELPFIALYIFDSQEYNQMQYGSPIHGCFRTKFLVETIQDLKLSLAQKNIPLVVKHAKSIDVFKELNKSFAIQTIFSQNEWTFHEMELEKSIYELFPQIRWNKSYSQFLIHPELTFSVFEKIPDLFTTFKQKIEKNFSVPQEHKIESISYKQIAIDVKSDEISLDTLGFDQFKIDNRTAFDFKGGESQGWKRLNYYFTESGLLGKYKETRNGLLGLDYSSKLSAWLANGSLSAVSIYHEVRNYEKHYGANESSYWFIYELFWRDFFKYVSIAHKNKIFHKKGIKDLSYPTSPNYEAITEWKAGKTACDFVNANMIELKNTGWMSNRGRQNVASYFCKTLHQDWRIGAAYFQEMLIDYDVHSNYGNWMYLAGVGNDNRDRVFNTCKQATVYDPEKIYRELWLGQ